MLYQFLHEHSTQQIQGTILYETFEDNNFLRDNIIKDDFDSKWC